MSEIKEEMSREFDKQKNYHAIMEKIEKKKQREKKKMVTIFLPVFSFTFAIVLFISLSPRFFLLKQENPISNPSQNQIIVNKIDAFLEPSLDMDVKIIDSTSEQQKEEFSFLNKVSLPEGVFLTNRYFVYIKETPQAEQYTKLHDYVSSYGTQDNSKKITLSFSKVGKPLRDSYLGDKGQFSIIKGARLQIYQYGKMYMVIGSHQGVYFDIETQGVTEKELITLLESLF